MKLFIDKEFGLISGFTVDPLSKELSIPAFEGFTPDNWLDWVLIDEKWVLDATEAKKRRGEEPKPVEETPNA